MKYYYKENYLQEIFVVFDRREQMVSRVNLNQLNGYMTDKIFPVSAWSRRQFWLESKKTNEIAQFLQEIAQVWLVEPYLPISVFKEVMVLPQVCFG